MKKKFRWEPSVVDENIANNPAFVKCYTVAIPNLPIHPNKRVVKFIEDIQKMDGFVGIRPEYPYGTLVVFDTLNHAKVGRNRINNYPEYYGGTGRNIAEIYIPKEFIEGLNKDGDRAEESMVD